MYIINGSLVDELQHQSHKLINFLHLLQNEIRPLVISSSHALALSNNLQDRKQSSVVHNNFFFCRRGLMPPKSVQWRNKKNSPEKIHDNSKGFMCQTKDTGGSLNFLLSTRSPPLYAQLPQFSPPASTQTAEQTILTNPPQTVPRSCP
jgi:hypothetical protein